MLHFAYGSNMDAVRLIEERLRPAGVAMGKRLGGRLDDWRLSFDKVARRPAGSGAATIVLAEGAVVHGTLNELPDAGFDVLDRWEGVAGGHYERRQVPVVRADTGKLLEATTYVALKVAEGLKPARAYLAHLLAGRDLLPADYWRELSRTPTFD